MQILNDGVNVGAATDEEGSMGPPPSEPARAVRTGDMQTLGDPGDYERAQPPSDEEVAAEPASGILARVRSGEWYADDVLAAERRGRQRKGVLDPLS